MTNCNLCGSVYLYLIVKDTKTGEEELNALWLEVEILTGIKFFCRETTPLTCTYYSDEANGAIEKLQDLNQRIVNQNDRLFESTMLQKLWIVNGMSTEGYLWKVKMSHMFIS